MNEIWDVIIIGAGMSGLGAGIRIAMSGKKVLILEQHNAIGGLNSFYLKDGIKYDVGLHALTNFVPQGSKGHPLNKLCRQLRIPYEALQLEEQVISSIIFPEIELTFNNNFDHFLGQIAAHFPNEIDRFRQLDKAVMAYPETELSGPRFISTRETLDNYLQNSLLKEMLLLPLFYYGSAHVNDLDWRQFIILYKAIYKEGFARPAGGVRTILKLLRERLRDLGGTLKIKSKVRLLQESEDTVAVTLESGEILYGKQVLSSAGYHETLRLLQKEAPLPLSSLGFAETITTFNACPSQMGMDKTIVFFNTSSVVDYRPCQELIDLRSGVLCVPENYNTETITARTTLRTTHLAGYDAWKQLDSTAYKAQKKVWLQKSRKNALQLLNSHLNFDVLAEDMFTPLTIERYTGHVRGAIYGSPQKYRNGDIGCKKIFICGTDQGFLGIVGAILSGISMANYHCLH